MKYNTCSLLCYALSLLFAHAQMITVQLNRAKKESELDRENSGRELKGVVRKPNLKEHVTMP